MAIRDITAPKAASKGSACDCCRLLELLPDDSAAHLLDLLRDRDVQYSWLAERLADDGEAREVLGYDIRDFTIGKHVRGNCAARTKLR